MKITVKLSRSWGNNRYYPVCDLTKMLCALLRRKSLTASQLETFKKCGYTIFYE